MRRARLLWASFALGSVSAIAACSALENFDSFVGPPLDAGTDGSDATAIDSAIDATTPTDGNTAPRDAGTDADAHADAAITDASPDGPYCELNPGHTFCEDFDEAPLANDWSLFPTNGTIALDTSTFTSAPKSAEAVCPPDDSGAQRSNVFNRQFPTASSIMVYVDAKVESSVNECQFIFLNFATNPSTLYGGCALDIAERSGVISLEIDCGGGTAPVVLKSAEVADASVGFHRYAFSYNVGTETVTGTIVDGGATASLTVPPGFTPQTLFVGLGADAIDACTVHVDNVIVDTVK